MINLSKNDSPNFYNPAPKDYDKDNGLYLWEIKDARIWAKTYSEAINLYNQIETRHDYNSHTEGEI